MNCCSLFRTARQPPRDLPFAALEFRSARDRRCEAMPFEAYSAYFRPEELDVLDAAYDAAWQDLWTERLTLGAEQASALQKNLAQIILASACNGKRDVDQLKEVALRGVSRQTRA